MSELPRDSALRLKTVIFAALIFFALAEPVGSAGEAADAPEAVPQTPHTPALDIPQGKYRFKFTWNGIPSAECEVVVRMRMEDGAPHYLFEATARTSAFVDIFWRFRASVAALVEALDGRARNVRTTEQENTRYKETETIFDYELGEAHYTRWKKGRIKQKTIDLGSGVIDLASLGMMLCRRPLEVGDSDGFTVLFKDDTYALEYEVTSRGRISATGREYDALRIEPTFHKISEKKRPPKIRQMTVWLSDPEPHFPLKMRSRTFIGHVTGELVKISPLESDNDDQPASQSQEVSQSLF